MNFTDSETKINLMRAFAGESQARNRYDFAAELAKKQNMYFISNIFKLTAKQEQQHAKIFYDFLRQENGSNITIDAAYPVGNYDSLEELLDSSRHNEDEEHLTVYPAFAETAMREGYPTIAQAWQDIAKIEGEHSRRFAAFSALMRECRLFKGDEDTEWICLNCGHIFVGKEVPKACPVCRHPQGYFVPYKYYKFIAEEYSLNKF